LLQTAHLKKVEIIIKTINECKWDPIKLTFFVLYAPAFISFCKHWPDDGQLRPKLIANSKITIKYYIVVSDGVNYRLFQ
jgi:hypothetical protein